MTFQPTSEDLQAGVAPGPAANVAETIPAAPNRGTTITQLEITADFNQTAQGASLVPKPAVPVAGLDPALIMWYPPK